MASRFQLSLPPHQSSFYGHKSQQQGPRRAPLTPSAVTPPSLNAYTSSASRRDSYGSGGSHRASALLAKVASHPSSPRRTPVSSPMASPVGEDPQHADQTSMGHEQWKVKSGQDAARHCWSHQRQQDGYISFPDFEKYWSNYEMQREHSRERASAKT